MFDRIKELLRGGHLICLDGERQEDGCLFIHSPDLKGFSLMLSPDDSKDFGTLIKAVEPSLLLYAGAFFTAKEKAREERAKERFEVIEYGRKPDALFPIKALLHNALTHC